MKPPDDGGPIFPSFSQAGKITHPSGGLSHRDWFATFAPEPTDEQVAAQGELDRLRNPHGDSYKPPRRSTYEIKADLKYAYADAMLAASKRERPT